MTNLADADKPAGWELIWRNPDIPARYQSLAAPNETVVEWANQLPQGGFVLDLGCGVGRHCVYLGGRGFGMAGLDISPTGIRLAQQACSAHGVSADLRLSDLQTVPWPDATFDAALSTSAIHHQLRADLQRCLGEVWRSLKPGGHFLVDFPCTQTFDYQLMREMVAGGQIAEVEPNTFVDSRPAAAGDDGYLPHHYCDEADLRDLLHAFDILRSWPALRSLPPERGPGLAGKWVAWLRKPAAPPGSAGF